jgi:hypothetical protein
MKTVHFDPNGGPVSAEIRSGFGNPGSYTLRLWERDSNAKAMPDVAGNFINADDDEHELPVPVADNDGRIVETFVTIAPMPGESQYFASLRIIQDRRLLSESSVQGKTDQPTVTLDLFMKLAEEEEA